MASLGHIDLSVSFPDPATGRGVAVNTLTIEVLNVFGTTVDTFVLGDAHVVQESTLLSGVVYVVYDYSIEDPAKTPGTALTLRYSATRGTESIGTTTKVVSFRPAAKDSTTGVLVTWPVPLDVMASARASVDPLFYEIRRIDERFATDDFIPSYTPGRYTLAYWSLNGNLLDSQTPAANLTLVNGRFIQEGTQVDPIRLDGNGYAWTASSKLTMDAGQDFSMSVLLRVNADGPTAFVMGKMGDKGTNGYGIWIESIGDRYYPSFYMGDGTNQVLFTSTTPLSVGRYYNICVTVDRDGMAYLYVDGVRHTGGDVSTIVTAVGASYDFRIGAEHDADPHYIYGDVGHCIMFSGVLTPLDIAEIYEGMLGSSSEVILGRSLSNQFLDTDISNPYQRRYYKWRIYRAVHVASGGEDGADYKFELIHVYNYKQVKDTGAPLCFVQGRMREPNDAYPNEAYVKFYVADRDSGQFVHGRYLGDDEIIVFPDSAGKFGAYLIQDSVMVCHMPEVHSALRFAVPQADTADLGSIPTERIRLRNNI